MNKAQVGISSVGASIAAWLPYPGDVGIDVWSWLCVGVVHG